jgi:hypothetical protein
MSMFNLPSPNFFSHMTARKNWSSRSGHGPVRLAPLLHLGRGRPARPLKPVPAETRTCSLPSESVSSDLERRCPSWWLPSCSTRGSGRTSSPTLFCGRGVASGNSLVRCMMACRGRRHIAMMRSEGWGARLCLHRDGTPSLVGIDGDA